MKAFGVVKGFDVVKKHGVSLGAVFRDAILEAFGFERSKKALHGSVIVTTSFSAHAWGDLKDFQDAAEIGRRVLDAAVGMMQLRNC